MGSYQKGVEAMKAQSIHPRVMYGNEGKKKNTAKPKSMRRLTKQLAGIEGHLENHSKDAISQTRMATIKREIAAM